MRVQLSKQECIWLADLAKKAKEQANTDHEAHPSRLFLIRRDNMADLETKLNAAVQREMQRERNGAR